MADIEGSAPTPIAIGDGLAQIRWRRRLSHVPAGVLIVLVLTRAVLRRSGVEMWLGGATLENGVVLAAGALLLLVPVASARCPRCTYLLFHMGPKYRNDFARACLWCGLRLDGKNVGSAYTVRSRV